MKRIVVDISISADEYLKLYQGAASTVKARSRDGLKVHFPAKILVPFVERGGVKGSFVIDCDSSNRFQQIQRLSPR